MCYHYADTILGVDKSNVGGLKGEREFRITIFSSASVPAVLLRPSCEYYAR